MSHGKWLGLQRVLLLVLAVGCGRTAREHHGQAPAAADSSSGSSPGGAASHDPLPEGGAEPEPSVSDGGAGVDPEPSVDGASVDPEPSAGGAPPTNCFSPTQHVELAQAADASGCPCGPQDSPACVGTHYLAPFRELSFACVEGAWAVVPAGACDGGSSCQTEDGIYASGAQGIPDPYSCNTCSCHDGELNCTERACPKPCPVNSMPALGCLDCVDGVCHVGHYACFTSLYVKCTVNGCFAESACADQIQ